MNKAKQFQIWFIVSVAVRLILAMSSQQSTEFAGDVAVAKLESEHSEPISDDIPNANANDFTIRKVKRKPRLPKKAVKCLKNWIYEHRFNPYPDNEEKLQLVSKTKLTLAQVNRWLTNARRRYWRDIMSKSGHDYKQYTAAWRQAEKRRVRKSSEVVLKENVIDQKGEIENSDNILHVLGLKKVEDKNTN